MKVKKLMRWTWALTLTGAGAALAVVTLDAWTGTGPISRPSSPPPVVTSTVPVAFPATDPSSSLPREISATVETAMTTAGLGGGVSRAVLPGSPDSLYPGRDDRVMLAAAPPVPAGDGRLLEQIETARAGLLAVQATVPARPGRGTGRAAWLPVVFLAGGGGLIGCALGLGLGSLFLRRRTSVRKVSATAPSVAPSRDLRPVAIAADNSADAVLCAARAELAARAAGDRDGSPAVSAGPGAAARMQALSRLSAASELATTVSSAGGEAVLNRRRGNSFFRIAPRRPKTVDRVDSGESKPDSPAVAPPAVGIARAVDPEEVFPMRRAEIDPVGRRIAALERSLLQVVRAMEEVAERVTERDASSVHSRHATRVRGQDSGEESPDLGQAGPLASRRHSGSGEDPERDALAPPMRAPRRHERDARLRGAATAPVAAAPSLPPAAPGPAAAPARQASSVFRAVRALRASRDQTPAVPEPWDLSPTAATSRGSAVTIRPEAAPSIPSASTVDGRDLVRIRRAVLRLAAEGWDGGRIAAQLRLGEGDVALIVKTAGAEQRLQPAGRGR